jgi:hypothetical protein
MSEGDYAILGNLPEDQTADYFRKNPQMPKFKLHDFRGTATSRARMAA